MTEKRKLITPNRHGQYDTVSKTIIHRNPKEWVEFSLGITGVEDAEVINTEQPTVKSNQADIFIQANVNGKKIIVHLEMQTHDSREIPMPYRMAGYIGRGIEAFQLPIYSHVIYLHPRAGRNDPGAYIQTGPGYNVRIEYKVIRLYDIEGTPFLEAGMKGLIPFTPLMRPPATMGPDAWIRQCVEAADSVAQGDVAKADYLSDLAILGGLVFDYPTIRETIMETLMQESSVIQHFLQQGIEQGIEQGETRAKQDALLKLLRHEFPNVPETLVNQIRALQDLQQLDAIFEKSLNAKTLEDIEIQ